MLTLCSRPILALGLPCTTVLSAAVLGSMPQVEVLHHTSPGVVFSTGRVSSWNSELMQGWAGWVSADTEGRWLQDLNLRGCLTLYSLHAACGRPACSWCGCWKLEVAAVVVGKGLLALHSLHAARGRASSSRS